MSPGTTIYQIFIVILFLPTAIRPAVCCSSHTFQLTPNVILFGDVSSVLKAKFVSKPMRL